MLEQIIIVDFETAGIEARRPSIQLGAVAMLGEDEIGTFNAFIQFDEAEADPEALQMNHYDRELWAKVAEPAHEVGERFCSWSQRFACKEMISKRTSKMFKVARIAGYNCLSFDMPRLDQICAGMFKPFALAPWDVRQLLLWYMELYPHAPRPADTKLVTACKFFQIEHNGAHGALSDARATAQLMRHLLRAIRAGGTIYA